MRWIEWVIAIVLVIIGLCCLTMSATWLLTPNTLGHYLHTLFMICMWAGLPLIGAAVIYFIYRIIKRQS
ncbi:hypothetical protein B0W44_08070 [Novibacillus thermophilus]|uniref:Uncharacterized protein n=1 Tax=Novibacillus thermophilus TaxID=1471761 RepID=A0A1U9K6R7_9BACL|nr:hypothetical protein B0W44_08070 [Novibacillus thermophilus]